jgi:hypothetical protein
VSRRFSLVRAQEGVATLVAVTIASFLILVLTVAVTILMVGELRQAEDGENSVKAYFAAQSATEEALQTIKAKLATGSIAGLSQNCDQTGRSGQPYTAAIDNIKDNITCLSVQAYSDSVESIAPKDQLVQFDLSNVNGDFGVGSISLDWDQSPPGTGSFPNVTSTNSWNSSAPPVMELTVTNYFPSQATNIATPNTPGISPDAQNNSSYTTTVVLLPQCTTLSSPSACPVYSSTPIYHYRQYSQALGTSVNVQCFTVSQGDRRCKATFDQITPQLGYRTVVGVRARYADASYRFQAFDTSPTPKALQIPVKNAQIDVTAKSGDSFTRVQTEVPIRSGAYASSVLYGDDSICKRFNVLDDGSGNYRIQQYTGSGGFCPIQ